MDDEEEAEGRKGRNGKEKIEKREEAKQKRTKEKAKEGQDHDKQRQIENRREIKTAVEIDKKKVRIKGERKNGMKTMRKNIRMIEREKI